MRPAGVDPEPQGEVLQLGAVAGEGAGERQGVVEREAVHPGQSGREPAQHGNVEMLAVVGDQDVVADKGAKLGPHLGKRGRIADVAVCVAMDRARP